MEVIDLELDRVAAQFGGVSEFLEVIFLVLLDLVGYVVVDGELIEVDLLEVGEPILGAVAVVVQDGVVEVEDGLGLEVFPHQIFQELLFDPFRCRVVFGHLLNFLEDLVLYDMLEVIDGDGENFARG